MCEPGHGGKASCICLYNHTFGKYIIKSERNETTLKGSELAELQLPGADKPVKSRELPGRYPESFSL